MDLNKGYAVTLPNSTPSTYEVMQDLQRQSERRRQEQLLQQQRDQARQGALVQYLGNTLDPKDYDQLLHTKVQDLSGKYAGMIRQNPNLNTADLQMLMQKDLTGLSQWNTALKVAQDNLKGQADAYKEYKNIDVQNAQRKALSNMLFEHDDKGNLLTDNGQPKLKDPSTIDFNKNYINDELYGPNGSLYLSGEPNVNDRLSKTPTSTQNITEQYRGYGPGKPLVTNKYNATLYPWQQVETSKDGKKSVATKYDPYVVNGKESGRMASENDFNWLVQNPDWRIKMQADYPKWAKAHNYVDQHGEPFPISSPEGQKIVRMQAYDMLDNIAPKKLEPVHEEVAPQYHFTVNAGSGDASKLSHPVDYWMDAVRNGKTGNILPQMGGGWKFPDGQGGFHRAESIVVDNDGTSHVTYKVLKGTDVLGAKQYETVTKDVSPDQLQPIIEKSIEANSSKDPRKNRQILSRWFTDVATPHPTTEQKPSFNLNASEWRKK